MLGIYVLNSRLIFCNIPILSPALRIFFNNNRQNIQCIVACKEIEANVLSSSLEKANERVVSELC